MVKVIGIGEMAVSNNENDSLKTFALASCVAMTVYCPLTKVLGMVHIALPYSIGKSDMERRGFYADTAVPYLIDNMCFGYGCKKESLIVNIYGAAQSIYKDDVFNIGSRNVSAVKEQLDLLNARLSYSDIGGYNSRTLEMDVATGTAKIQSHPMRI